MTTTPIQQGGEAVKQRALTLHALAPHLLELRTAADSSVMSTRCTAAYQGPGEEWSHEWHEQ